MRKGINAMVLMLLLMIRFVIMLFVSDVRMKPELRSVRNDYEGPGALASVSVKRQKDLDYHDLRLLFELFLSIGNEGDTKTERLFVG